MSKKNQEEEMTAITWERTVVARVKCVWMRE